MWILISRGMSTYVWILIPAEVDLRPDTDSEKKVDLGLDTDSEREVDLGLDIHRERKVA